PISSPHPATTPTYTLSLHDALPICTEPVTVEFRTRADHAGSRWIAARIANHLHDRRIGRVLVQISDIDARKRGEETIARMAFFEDRKSTRLNSSHVKISYAVFCLKK